MKIEADLTPLARVFYLGDESIYPGWYLQRYEQGELRTSRLEIRRDADVFDAVVEAAASVGCVPQQVQIEGQSWPPFRLAEKDGP